MLLLKDLKPMKETADRAEYNFLSYLLGMAILEAQSIASGTGDVYAAHCGICGSSHDENLLDAVEISH